MKQITYSSLHGVRYDVTSLTALQWRVAGLHPFSTLSLDLLNLKVAEGKIYPTETTAKSGRQKDIANRAAP